MAAGGPASATDLSQIGALLAEQDAALASTYYGFGLSWTQKIQLFAKKMLGAPVPGLVLKRRPHVELPPEALQALHQEYPFGGDSFEPTAVDGAGRLLVGQTIDAVVGRDRHGRVVLTVVHDGPVESAGDLHMVDATTTLYDANGKKAFLAHLSRRWAAPQDVAAWTWDGGPEGRLDLPPIAMIRQKNGRYKRIALHTGETHIEGRPVAQHSRRGWIRQEPQLEQVHREFGDRFAGLTVFSYPQLHGLETQRRRHIAAEKKRAKELAKQQSKDPTPSVAGEPNQHQAGKDPSGRAAAPRRADGWLPTSIGTSLQRLRVGHPRTSPYHHATK